MARTKLKNEAWRPFYNHQMAYLRRMVAFVNRYPAHENVTLYRLAIKETRIFLRCIRDDVRPVPPMPHVKRCSELHDDAMDLKILDWNDRQLRIQQSEATS